MLREGGGCGASASRVRMPPPPMPLASLSYAPGVSEELWLTCGIKSRRANSAARKSCMTAS